VSCLDPIWYLLLAGSSSCLKQHHLLQKIRMGEASFWAFAGCCCRLLHTASITPLAFGWTLSCAPLFCLMGDHCWLPTLVSLVHMQCMQEIANVISILSFPCLSCSVWTMRGGFVSIQSSLIDQVAAVVVCRSNAWHAFGFYQGLGQSHSLSDPVLSSGQHCWSSTAGGWQCCFARVGPHSPPIAELTTSVAFMGI
jgi:hypothetical protein